MSRLFLSLLCVFSLSLLSPVVWADDSEEHARKCYQDGQRAYDLGQYQEAIAQFELGYKLSGLPAFLLNIAQAYRMKGSRSRALEFYQRYLDKVEPTDPTVEGVQKLIAELSSEGSALSPQEKELQKLLGDDYNDYLLSGLTPEGYQSKKRATKLFYLSLSGTGVGFLGGLVIRNINDSLAVEGKSSAALSGLGSALLVVGYVGLYASYYTGSIVLRANQQKRPVQVSLSPLGVSLQF